MSLTFTDTIVPGDASRKYIKKQHIKEIRDYLNLHIFQAGTGDVDPNIQHPLATTSFPGFMSAADKALLTNLVTNAGTVLSVSATGAITSTGGNNPVVGISNAVASVGGSGGSPGAMMATDKEKLDTYPNNYADISSAINLKGTGSVTSVTVKIGGEVAAVVDTSTTTPVINLPDATAAQDGLMTKEQAAKLAGLLNVPIGGMIMFAPLKTDNYTIVDFFDLGNGTGKTNSPYGDMSMFALCDGYAANGTQDMKGRFPFGAAVQADFQVIGGSQKVKLAMEEIPPHRHLTAQWFSRNDQRIISTPGIGSAQQKMDIELGDSYMDDWSWFLGDGTSSEGWSPDYSFFSERNPSAPGETWKHTWTSSRLFRKVSERVTNNTPHENMPPYNTVWFIQRVA